MQFQSMHPLIRIQNNPYRKQTEHHTKNNTYISQTHQKTELESSTKVRTRTHTHHPFIYTCKIKLSIGRKSNAAGQTDREHCQFIVEK